jgi:site-specific DNA recombinase
MPSINGQGQKRAILYTRVSGDEQKKRGYSLFDQRDALRAWASENGYEVVEEIEDAGYSGAYLERPGLDRARALVRSGAADAVAVLFRDRIARGVYAQLLAEEFRQHEARLVALNSGSDDSPDGELSDNILDVIAAWERKKIAERMNRGKRRKAKDGKVIAGPSPDYGFRYNENRDGNIVDEKKMSIVRRIFRMVGIEGATLSTVRRTLEQEGLLAPSGRKGWSNQYLRTRINDDVYLSQTFEEVVPLVSPEVAASLDPSLSYGVWWYGKMRHISGPRRSIAPDGAPLYGKTRKSVSTPRQEWIAVPVPDADIPKEWILAARNAIEANEWVSNAGHRVWELTEGVIRCAECGRAMSTNYIASRNRAYYRCTGHYNGGIEKRCSMNHALRADKAEEKVWKFVSEVLTNPSRLARGIERMSENERQPLSGEDEASWLKRISEVDRKQERLLNLHLDGDITAAQFRAKSAELSQARVAAEGQLEVARSRIARLEDLKRSRDELVSHYASLVPSQLQELTPEDRRRVYKMMSLRVLAHPDDTLIADWGCNDASTLPGSFRTRGR